MQTIQKHIHERLHTLAAADPGDNPDLLLNSTFLDGVCSRKIWLNLRGFKPFIKLYKRWRRQKQYARELPHQLAELRQCGIMVETVHPKTKQPIVFLKEGIKTHMTGIAKVEFKEAEDGLPSGWFLVQVDNVTTAQLEKVCQTGIKYAHPTIWGHCVFGMGHSRVHHCLVYLSSDNGAVYAEFLQFDEAEFNRLSVFARGLLLSPGVPERLEASECTRCHYQEVCHSPNYIPPVSCFTCHYHTVQEGVIACGKHQRLMEEDVWQEGCSSHLYMHQLINFAKKQSEVTLENAQLGIIYKLEDGTMFTNCGSKVPRKGMMFSSTEIYVGGIAALNNKMVQDVKNCFEGAKIVSPV